MKSILVDRSRKSFHSQCTELTLFFSAESHISLGQSTIVCSPLFTFTNRNFSGSYLFFLYSWIVSALVADGCHLFREVTSYLIKKTEHKPWFLEPATVAGWGFGEEWAVSSSCEGFRGKGWSRREHVSVGQSVSWSGDTVDCLSYIYSPLFLLNGTFMLFRDLLSD